MRKQLTCQSNQPWVRMMFKIKIGTYKVDTKNLTNRSDILDHFSLSSDEILILRIQNKVRPKGVFRTLKAKSIVDPISSYLHTLLIFYSLLVLSAMIIETTGGSFTWINNLFITPLLICAAVVLSAAIVDTIIITTLPNTKEKSFPIGMFISWLSEKNSETSLFKMYENDSKMYNYYYMNQNKYSTLIISSIKDLKKSDIEKAIESDDSDNQAIMDRKAFRKWLRNPTRNFSKEILSNKDDSMSFLLQNIEIGIRSKQLQLQQSNLINTVVNLKFVSEDNAILIRTNKLNLNNCLPEIVRGYDKIKLEEYLPKHLIHWMKLYHNSHSKSRGVYFYGFEDGVYANLLLTANADLTESEILQFSSLFKPERFQEMNLIQFRKWVKQPTSQLSHEFDNLSK